LNFIKRIRARMRRRKRIKAAMAATDPLRQFVYLDEVSVYSLLASREGALPAEYTQTETMSATDGFNSSLSGTIGLAKTGVSSKSESTRSQSFQVLRKSSVQAAFKDLRYIESNKLALAPIDHKQDVPRIDNWSDLEKAVGSAQFDGWIIDPDRLARGDLIEIKVELQAERFYRIASIVSAMQGILEGGREFFDVSAYSNAGYAKAMGDILTRLMVGLIPVECRATDYKVAEVNGRKQIIHVDLLNQVDATSLRHCEDLFVTGVAEEASFWKDVRGVLFSGATYYVMCRLNHAGMRNSWTPVKLVDVLRDVSPDIEHQLAQLKMIPDQAVNPAPVQGESSRLLEAAVLFGEKLAANYAISIPRDELLLNYDGILQRVIDPTDVEARRQFFDAVKDVVQKWLPEVPSAELVASIREAAIRDSGFELDGTVTDNSSSLPVHPQNTDTPKAIIDTEIIAIYW
jgi:hypothetical protein